MEPTLSFIRRVNRLNESWKDYGHIVDYRHLFQNIQGAIEDYTNGAFSGYDKDDIAGVIKGDLTDGKRVLEEALERCRMLSEPVKLPRSIDDYFDWFCFDQVRTPAEGHEPELQKNAQKREDFYQACYAAVRAFSSVAIDITKVYTEDEANILRSEVKNYDEIRNAIMKRCGDFADLKRFDAEIRSQPREARREYVSGENVYCLGKRYRLLVTKEDDGAVSRLTWGGNELRLSVRAGATRAERGRIIESWQKEQLRDTLTRLVTKWVGKLPLGERPAWTVRKMKTRWGSCSKAKRSFLFNAELARVPISCIEYVVVHEMTHLSVSDHSALFKRMMARRLPRWREAKRELNEFIAMPMEDR